jgi:hypothetical protein
MAIKYHAAYIALLILLALSLMQIGSLISKPIVRDCTITFSDSTGNRHQFIGKGSLY